MTFLLKRPRIKLQGEAYRQLCQQVLDRDGWRCQVCGSRTNLEVHHRQFRSRGGNDTEENLITMCSACHSKVHNPTGRLQVIYLADARCKRYL